MLRLRIASESRGDFEWLSRAAYGRVSSMDTSALSPTEPARCAICEREPGTVDALWDHRSVRVCAPCFRYETGEEPAA
jgi:hypothetical protein